MGLRALLAVTALHAPLRAVVAHRAYPTDRLRRNPQSARVAADYGPLIVAVAGLLCRFILNLMGTEAYTLGQEEPETATPAPRPAEPAVAPAPQRRPARVVAGAPVLH
jgi:hypothetical protein